jgi:probable F420-dependent oxidoreductase
MRPFRFGVVSGNAASGAEWVSKARRAEDLGYAILLVPDHIVIGIAPLTALAVAAASTTSLRVGSLVLGNDFRHPAWLAKEAATLDLLSDGRFELGLGAGYLPADYAQTGLAFDPPGTRVGRLDEALQIVDQLFSDRPVSFAGAHYTVAGLQGRPTPVQRPRPPIFVGGTGKRLLSVAARRADSIGVGFTVWRTEVTDVKPEDIERKVDWVREAAGDRFERLELGYTVFQAVVSDAPPEASRPTSPHVLAGSVDEIVMEIVRRRERHGFSYVQVMEQQMEAFAPVVARLAGT